MTQLGLLQFGGLSIEVKLALLLVLVAVAAGFDIKSRRIPNWLVLVGLISIVPLALSSTLYGRSCKPGSLHNAAQRKASVS